jgi:NAD(P)-dependent dehydrogenase (short-subunit alcohol dehydrogenase family)
MVAQKSGSVIAMASIYSFVGAPFNSIYCMTKGGLLQLSRALAIEWARHNVRVNAICPGWIETDLTKPICRTRKRSKPGCGSFRCGGSATRDDRTARGPTSRPTKLRS